MPCAATIFRTRLRGPSLVTFPRRLFIVAENLQHEWREVKTAGMPLPPVRLAVQAIPQNADHDRRGVAVGLVVVRLPLSFLTTCFSLASTGSVTVLMKKPILSASAQIIFSSASFGTVWR